MKEEGEWHLLPGASNLGTVESWGQDMEGARNNNYIAEMECPTHAPQETLLHDSIFSSINVVPQH